MPLATGKSLVRVRTSWQETKTVTGFPQGNQKGYLAFSVSPSTTTYNAAYQTQFTLAAAGTQAVDFYSFTSGLGTATTATKLLGVMVTATATVTGGQVKIAPHGTNPLTWPFSGTTPAITLDVGTAGCCVMLMGGTTQTLSSTVRQWLITNSGTQSVTVSLMAFVGTA